MTILSIGMFFVFGVLALRHFLNRRFVWGAFASIGALLGAGSFTVDVLRASDDGVRDHGASPVSSSAKNAWSKDS